MPRKRKSDLTLGQRYKRTKYKKINKTDNHPKEDWNQDISSLLKTTEESEDTNNPSILEKIYEVYLKVKEAGQESFFVLFLEMILCGKFSFTNIAFVLFADFVTWVSLSTTTTMRYSEASKEFWWTGQKLFGGKFVRFMQGFKHKGSVVDGTSQRGIYNPQTTSVNFAVPSESILSSYCPIEALKDIKGEIGPGIVSPLLQMTTSDAKDKTHILTFDGKKIIPNTADIDLLGCEDETTLQQQNCVAEDTTYLTTIDHLVSKMQESKLTFLDHLSEEEKSELKNNFLQIFRHIGKRLQLTRKLKQKKLYALSKLQSKPKTLLPKEQFMMNYLKTFIYQCSNVVQQGVGNLNGLCSIVCAANGTLGLFSEDESVDLNVHTQYAELLTPDEMQKSLKISESDELPAQYVKQRSSQWHALRKEVKVTGSTLGRAVGISSLKEQKEFFDEYIEGKTLPKSDYQKHAIEYGSRNEENAVGTMVGKIMPILFPGLTFCEEGAYRVKDEATGEPLLVVSPDGSLRYSNEQMVDLDRDPYASIEIKCPYSSFADGVPVYEAVPKRHLPQCFMEQLVVNTQDHLLLCWTSESTTVFRIPSCKHITEDLIHEAKEKYYAGPPRRPTRLSSSSKTLSNELSQYVKECQFLGEFPSVTSVVKTKERTVSDQYPYYVKDQHGTPTSNQLLSMEKACRVMLQSKDVLKKIQDLYNRKASEVVVFSIADSDRKWEREIGHGIPIGYFFKGYSLTSKCMRNIASEMLRSCFDSKLHVPCTTFDGQWFKLIEEDAHGRPLTVFQLQRNHWKSVGRMTVKAILDSLCAVQIVARWKFTRLDDSRPVIEACSNDNILKQPNIRPNIVSNAAPVHQTPVFTSQNEENVNLEEECTSFQLSTENKADLVTILLASKRKKNKFDGHTLTAERISELLGSEAAMHSLTCLELKAISKYLKSKWKGLCFDTSGNKGAIIKSLSSAMQISGCDTVRREKGRKRKSSPQKLQVLVKTKLKSFGKKYMQAVYAQYTWPKVEKEWRDSAPVALEIHIEGLEETFVPVYVPEHLIHNDKTSIHINCLDGHHIRSNIRTKICKGGTRELKREAWMAVAKSGKTALTNVMMEVNKDGKILYQQNDYYIRVMFSEEVEEQLMSMGYKTEAHFTNLLRSWHNAEDLPGMSALERCQKSLTLRKWMLNNFDVGTFPPPGAYIKGFPKVTFEGI